MRKIIIFFIVFCIPFSVLAQTTNLDPVYNKIKKMNSTIRPITEFEWELFLFNIKRFRSDSVVKSFSKVTGVTNSDVVYDSSRNVFTTNFFILSSEEIPRARTLLGLATLCETSLSMDFDIDRELFKKYFSANFETVSIVEKKIVSTVFAKYENGELKFISFKP